MSKFYVLSLLQKLLEAEIMTFQRSQFWYEAVEKLDIITIMEI